MFKNELLIFGRGSYLELGDQLYEAFAVVDFGAFVSVQLGHKGDRVCRNCGRGVSGWKNEPRRKVFT